MRLLGSTKKDVDADKNSENVPKLESVEVVLVHCNLVKNDYQHSSKVLFSFVLNKNFGQPINISINTLTIITQPYFSVPKDVRLNSTHYLIMKINNKRELQNITNNHSADIDYQDSMKIYRECTK